MHTHTRARAHRDKPGIDIRSLDNQTTQIMDDNVPPPSSFASHPSSSSISSNATPEQPSNSDKEHGGWNRGKQLADAHRSAISHSLSRRWQDPQFRARITEGNKGKPPWNKGRSLSEETKEKMRLAKLNKPVTRSTRQKMSESHRGKAITATTRAILSSKHVGRPKSEDHKAAIASGQRRRLAAVRVLAAVEAVYSHQGNESDGEQNGGSGVKLSRAGKAALNQERSQALNAFKAELREFRALQDELSPWTEAFVERHGRKPTPADVQATGIEWLISRYKQYIMLRDRVFTETSVLRERLDRARNGTGSGSGGNGSRNGMGNSSLGRLGPTNANGPTVEAKSAMATRVSAAMQYKMKKDEEKKNAAGVSADGSPSAVPKTTPNGSPMLPLPSMAWSDTSPKVKAAMQAAMEYRKRKAEATKAKAVAAAVSAKSGWAEGRTVSSPCNPAVKTAPVENGSGGSSGLGAASCANTKTDANESVSMATNKAVPPPQQPKTNTSTSGTIDISTITTGATTTEVEVGAEGPACLLPAEVVRAQAAAHRAMIEVKQAEAEVRRALRLDGPEEGGGGEGIAASVPV